MALISGSARPAVFVAFVAFLAIVAHVAVPAVGKTHTCGDIKSADKECTFDLAAADIFTLDCSGASDVVKPDGLLATLDTKVCKSPAKWTKADTTCADADIQGQLSLVGKGIAVAAVNNILTITNNKYSGGEMRLSGSCSSTDKSKSAFFNLNLKSSAFSSLSATGSIILAVLATGFLSTTF